MNKNLSKNEAKERIKKLRELIEKYRYSRHVIDKELVSIEVEDSLKKELFDLEQLFPEFITSDSPAQRVGGKPLEKFEKFKHPAPMLSLNDAFTDEDIKDWLERISKLLTKEEFESIDFYCEPKLDGLAIELIYRDKKFTVGATRGDGIIGENVTQNLKTIESVPLKLRDIEEIVGDLDKEGEKELANFIRKNGLKEVIVRGEAIITKKNFELVNKEQERLGQILFANPRNLAAGSIRQLDPKVTAKRKLEVWVYNLVSELGQKTHWQEHKILQALGFKTNNKYSKYCKDLKEVIEFREYWLKNRESLPYEIDGIVVQINNNNLFQKLGAVGKAPRGAIAFKFPLREATTILKEVKFQVGRTGIITPVAILEPVDIGGVIISRATLHNEDVIKKLGVKIGDTIVIGRAGDVIPDVIKVLTELRTGKEKEIKFPTYCPVCQKKLEKSQGQALWKCKNQICPAKERKFFYHFVHVFNIVGLGPKIIDRLLDEGLIKDPADLFLLKEKDICCLERFGEKSAKNLILAINSKKKIDLAQFIYALGINNVGEQTAKDLAEHFNSLEELAKADLEKLCAIKEVGPVVAESIYKFFREEKNLKLIKKLKKIGVKIINEKKSVEQLLTGLTFVITGTLNSMSRDEAKRKIEKLGGKLTDNVSKKVNFLVVGKEPGSKFQKAKVLGIKTISEEEFLNILNGK